MGACVSGCYPCSSSSPSIAGGSPALSHLHTAKHVVAVHLLPLASNAPAPTTSTSSSSLFAASSAASMATSSSSSSSATTRSYSSSSSSPRPFSTGYLKVRTCRDMEFIVLDPNINKNKNKLSRSASATPRPLLPRAPPGLFVVKSPTMKKPGTASNGRRKTAPTATTVRRVRPLPSRAPLTEAWAGGSASCRKKRLSTSPSSCKTSRSMDLDGRRKRGSAATAGASGVGGGEFVDDLNNPHISMDCFIFL